MIYSLRLNPDQKGPIRMTLSQLTLIAMQYISFMTSVGQIDSQNAEIDKQAMTKLFSEKIRKVENGKIIVEGHEQLLAQLKQAQSYAAPWTMKVLDTLADPENNAAVIRFTWNSDVVGLHITTAILKCDTEGRIYEIAEVYNKHSDITH